MSQDRTYHDPVLLTESVDGLNIRPDGVYVDATYGGGGHSREVLSRLGQDGTLLALDQDMDAHRNAIDDPRFKLIHANFRYIKRFLRLHGHKKVDGILADLGVSSHQFDQGGRGFSTRYDGQLDMRMDQDQGIDAAHILAHYDQDDLTRIFRDFGDLRIAPKIARQIAQERQSEPIKTTERLKQICRQFTSEHRENKLFARVFQSIRIEVNAEIASLKAMLLQTSELLPPGGRLAIISYHSLEDRPVKRFMRNGLFEGEPERDVFGRFSVPFKQLGKMKRASEAEISRNNRARSAKLRVAERLKQDQDAG